MTAQTIEAFAASIGAEIVNLDLTWESPRTETACNKLTSHGLCPCTEFVPGGPRFGRDTEPSCAKCHDTLQIHKKTNNTKKAKRS